MNEQEIKTLLDAHAVIRPGHFLRASGRHSDHYVQCAGLFRQAAVGEVIGRELAGHFRDAGAQAVFSAAVGAILPGWEVSRALGLPFIYCERKDGAMTLRRGFSIEPGTAVLIVEDEVQTGTSVREMTEIVRALGGHVVGVGCIVDKSGGTLSLDAPFAALYTQRVEHYSHKACPLCEAGIPLDAYG